MVTLYLFDIRNNSFSGSLPENFAPLLSVLLVSNNNINGSIPESVAKLPLSSIDLSNTKICVGSFPSQWVNMSFKNCVLKVNYPCGIPLPTNTCVLNECTERMKCFVDQCATGMNECQDGRTCIQNTEYWNYSCTNCPINFLSENNGIFKCSIPRNSIIIISFCSVGLILVLSIAFIIVWKKYGTSFSLLEISEADPSSENTLHDWPAFIIH